MSRNGKGMTEEEFQDRMDEMLVEELASEPERWWWASFASGTGFLGVAIVRAHGPITTVLRTRELGINPGGKVLMYAVPDDLEIDERYTERLLSIEELEESGLVDEI